MAVKLFCCTLLGLDVELNLIILWNRGDGERVALYGHQGVAREENMLASVPADWRVFDGNSRSILRNGGEFRLTSPKTLHIAFSALLGMEIRNVRIYDI